MKRLTDEILNKYIDGELTRAELEEVKELIESNPDELNRLKAHKFVDQTLHEMKYETAPSGITQKILNKIYEEIPQKYRKSNFFKYVIGTFGLVLVIVTGYTLSILPSGSEPGKSQPLIETNAVKNFSTDLYNKMLSFFSNDNLIYIGLFLTVIMLVTAYFVHESHKSFKKKLERLV